MFIHQIALVSQSKKIKFSDLTKASAALQKQATKDLSPIWGVKATVDVFENLSDIPLGYWPVIIMDQLDDPSAAGYHDDKNHQPYALVEYSDSWTLTCSHEICEMLVDPYGNKMKSGLSPNGKERVHYLVEVCDPCEDSAYAYFINGFLVSDFYTPDYFDSGSSGHTRYSFKNSIQKPCQILKNGYLSWYSPKDKHWHQATYFGSKVTTHVLKGLENMEGSLRSRVDRLTRFNDLLKGIKNKTLLKQQMDLGKITNLAGNDMQDHWEQEIGMLLKPKKIR
ncbi:MAG: hypothetical protein JSU03_04820 [Bacteroidetes bacterium]|nr:hypothetical protein [Bacteroidota bacterium]